MVSPLFQPTFKSIKNRLFLGGRIGTRTLSLVLLGGGICLIIFWATLKAVGYFHSQNELGIILSLKIFQMGWMTIFAMLIFSSMVTSVSTLYLSEDNEIILSSPVHLSDLYLMRYATTSIYTSWMMVVFSLPIFCAFGIVFKAGLLYYPLLFLTILATAGIGCALAMLLTVLLVYLFPAKRTKDIVFYLSLCFGILLYFVFRMIRPEELVNPEKYSQFVEYLSAISTPAGPWLPAGWAANLLSGYLLDREIDYLFIGLLVTTPLVLYFCGEIAMKRLFLSGYSKSQESFGGHRAFKKPPYHSHSSMWIIKKELKLFLRDSSEWSQLFMIGALIIVYLYNFTVLPLDRAPIPANYLSNIIAFGNIGLSGFLAASLAARFVYPSIGAEGGAIYLIRSSPLPLYRFMLYKYLFYLIPFTLLTLILILISNNLLQIEGVMWWISLFTGLVINWTVTALALGFGTLYADFKAENKVASMGPGAILYLFWAMTYQVITILLITIPAYRLVKLQLLGFPPTISDLIMIIISVLGIILFSFLTVVLLWRKGLDSLK